MSNTVISLRSSANTGNLPSVADLANGELALNFADGILYYKTASGTLGSIRTTSVSGLNKEVQFNDSGSFGGNANFTFDKATATLSTVNVKATSVNVTSYYQFSDGTRQYTANAGLVTAQAAFDKANIAGALAQGGFDKANSANTLAQAGFDKANSANVLAQTAYNTANVANTTANAIVAGTKTLSNVTIASGGKITFGDSKTQNTRAPVYIVNADWDAGYDINNLLPGDMWFDSTDNKLYIYTDFGSYNDFFDVTPQKF